jgi:hypothetical protein
VVDVKEEGEKVEVLDSREAIRGRLKKKIRSWALIT